MDVSTSTAGAVQRRFPPVSVNGNGGSILFLPVDCSDANLITRRAHCRSTLDQAVVEYLRERAA